MLKQLVLLGNICHIQAFHSDLSVQSNTNEDLRHLVQPLHVVQILHGQPQAQAHAPAVNLTMNVLLDTQFHVNKTFTLLLVTLNVILVMLENHVMQLIQQVNLLAVQELILQMLL